MDKRKIKILSFQTDDQGEFEAVFDEDDNVIDLWYENDARWRSEYFNGFMKTLDIEVTCMVEDNDKYEALAIAHIGY